MQTGAQWTLRKTHLPIELVSSLFKSVSYNLRLTELHTRNLPKVVQCIKNKIYTLCTEDRIFSIDIEIHIE